MSTLIWKFSSVQAFKRSSVQAFKRSSVQAPKFYFALGFLLFCFLNVSCTRSKPTPNKEEQTRGLSHVFKQGEADHLYNITHFQAIDIPAKTLNLNALSGKSLQIKTSQTGEKAKVSVSKSGALIDSHLSFVNQYYFLDYDILETKTDTQNLLKRFFGKVKQFKGLPGTVYTIVPYIESNYLIFYRLSDPKTVPYDELPVSVKVGDKTATPLVGYPIQYCVAEKILNINNEQTGQNRAKCEGVTKENAEYIRLKEQDKKVFNYQPKVDVFPENFFNGQWFFVKSIVKSSQDTVTGFHQAFKSAYLVEFNKAPDSLKVSDASGYEIEEKDKITGFAIPVEWKEYELDQDSDIIHRFAEREKADTQDIKRPYFKIKFTDLVQNEITTATNNNKDNNKDGITAETETVFITDDYFSFTIRVSGDKNYWIKYAFKKATENQHYVEKQWFEDDSTKFFPVFYAVRKYYNRVSEHTQREKERFFRVTRFNPRSVESSTQVIKWHFSKQTPHSEWLRDLGRKAVVFWDKAFQEAGKGSDHKIRIVLDESEDKELGDIRYNIINLMYSKASQAGFLLGFGPNISNPVTGEVVSATANVWINHIIDLYTNILRKYIRFHIFPPLWRLLPDSPAVTWLMHEKIQQVCPEVTGFINREKAKNNSFHPEKTALKDKQIIKDCVMEISRPAILFTILHEMGHGFAYRHVFSASVDEDNFYSDYDEIKKIFGKDILFDNTKSHPHPAQFSSVMDYGNLYFPLLTVPGKYDIAATRFVYFNKVELQGKGKLFNIPAGADTDSNKPQKSILETESTHNVLFKRYKVCGGKQYGKPGGESSDIHKTGPVCAQFDYGVTPFEIMNNIAEAVFTELMRDKYRYDSARPGHYTTGGIFHPDSFIVVALNRWIGLRTDLMHRHGKRISDFSFLDERHIKEYKKLIAEEIESNPEFKLYYGVRQAFFNFYKKLFFIPVKRCVYRKSDGSYNATALEVIERRIEGFYPSHSREIFMNCQSPAVQKWAEENEKGEFVAEVGVFGENRAYFLKTTLEDEFDELSMFMPPTLDREEFERLSKIPTKLFHVVSPWMYIINSGINITVEPDFAKEFIQEIKMFFLEGVDLNPYLNRPLATKLPRFPAYDIESNTGTQLNMDLILQNGILAHKSNALRDYVELLLTNTLGNQNIQNDFKRHFGMYHTSLSSIFSVLGDRAESLDENFLLGTSIPPVQTLYQEYKKSIKDQQNIGFREFITQHPDVCVHPTNQEKIIIPFTLTFEGNFRLQMCRKFNKYRKCIANDSADTPCEDLENKKSYVEWVLLSVMP